MHLKTLSASGAMDVPDEAALLVAALRASGFRGHIPFDNARRVRVSAVDIIRVRVSAVDIIRVRVLAIWGQFSRLNGRKPNPESPDGQNANPERADGKDT